MIRVRNLLLLGLIFAGIFPNAATGTDAKGDFVFEFGVVEKFGGVVLQGTAEFYDEEGYAISPDALKLQLDTQSDRNQRICVVFEETCYRIEMSPDVAISLAEWVLTEQTGAYTAPASVNDVEEHLIQVDDRGDSGGFAPVELSKGLIPTILAFLDFDDLLLNSIDDNPIREKYNMRLGPNFNPESYDWEDRLREGSINTDTDTDFITHLVDGQVQSEGLISRYTWVRYPKAKYPYIETVQRACSPESIREFDIENCSGLTSFSGDEYGYDYNSDYYYTDSFESGENIAFYLAVNTTVDSALTNQADVEDLKPKNIFLSLPDANADGFDHIISNLEENGTLSLQWEDRFSGGDEDFNVMVNVSVYTASGSSLTSEGTGIFQINGQSGDRGYLDFRVVGKDAAYINEFGVFKVDDAEGSIDGLTPNHPDYMNAVLSRSGRLVSDVRLVSDINSRYLEQKEATTFVQTAAIFRRFAEDNPQVLEEFIRKSKL